MVKLYDDTIALIDRVAALPLESEPIAEERAIIIEARRIQAAIKELS